MKTTIEIPDGLYRRVKVKSAQSGRPVCDITCALYLQWIDGRVDLSQREDAFDAVDDGLDALIGRISKCRRLTKKSALQVLKEDRR